MSNSKNQKYDAYRQALLTTNYPLAFLCNTAFNQNIAHHLKNVGSKSIRIATKSIRVPHLIKELVHNYDAISGVMCYHGLEALYLAEQGLEDILLGYPIADKQVLAKIGSANKVKSRICLMVDSIAQIELVQSIAIELNVDMPICLDIDLSMDIGPLHFGVYRSPLINIDSLQKVIDFIKKCSNVRLKGLMGYEAQIAGVPDRAVEYGLKNRVIRIFKNRSIKKLRKWRAEALAYLTNEGFELDFVNGGGTGSLYTTVEETSVSEITIGSGFYASHLFDNFEGLGLQPALFYAIQITRKPKPGIFTAHGGGYVASGQIENLKQPKVHLPIGARLSKQEGVGEVQTPILYSGGVDLKIGDPVFLRHAKAGEVLERFEKVLIYDNGTITKQLKTYRGEGQCFG